MKNKYVFWLIAAIAALAIFIKGTDLSNHEIVSIYISNKDFYDKLIKRSMDIQKEYIPDSMPRSSLPQLNSDSIHAAVHQKISVKTRR